MKILLPWEKDENGFRRKELTKTNISAYAINNGTGWTYNIFDTNTIYTRVRGHEYKTEEEAKRGCDQKLVEIGCKLLLENDLERYRNKLITLI